MLSHERKRKIIHEMKEYWINVAFLAVFFMVFVMYRRLTLAAYEITYENFGLGLVKALILAKVVLIIDALGQGKRYEDRPLIVSVLYKALVFTLWALAFTIFCTITAGALGVPALLPCWRRYSNTRSLNPERHTSPSLSLTASGATKRKLSNWPAKD